VNNLQRGKTMIQVKKLIEILNQLPADAMAYAYEGEVIGIVIQSSEGKELGYIPTTESEQDEAAFVRNEKDG